MKFSFLNNQDKERALAYLKKLMQTPAVKVVEIQPKRQRRTTNQNEYLWGCVYPMILNALTNEGWDYTTTEEVHELFKRLYTRHEIVNRNTGEVVELPRDTRAMDTVTFTAYIDNVRDYASEYLALEIPDPDKEWKKKRNTL